MDQTLLDPSDGLIDSEAYKTHANMAGSSGRNFNSELGRQERQDELDDLMRADAGDSNKTHVLLAVEEQDNDAADPCLENYQSAYQTPNFHRRYHLQPSL